MPMLDVTRVHGDPRGITNMNNVRYLDGAKFNGVIIETVIEEGSIIPVARAVTHLPPDMEVHLDRDLRTEFPVGTRFHASGSIWRKKWKGESGIESRQQFEVEHATAIVDSIPDDNLRAILDKVKADSSTRRVRNCRSAFKCDKAWDELEPTRTSGVRHCDDCDNEVFLCDTIAEICTATKEGKCVAVMAATIAEPRAQDFVGYVVDDDSTF